MEVIKSYKDLLVWQKSIYLVTKIYERTKQFPRHELFGLVSQMQRAAISIPSNIAEGFGRKTIKDRVQFITIAYSSALELETQLIIAYNLKYIDKQIYEDLTNQVQEILKMLNSIRRKLSNY